MILDKGRDPSYATLTGGGKGPDLERTTRMDHGMGRRFWRVVPVQLRLVVLAIGCSTISVWSSLPFAQTESASSREQAVTVPIVSYDVSAVEELRLGDTSYAVIRKPPGEGPFPTVVFLHGGLGQRTMSQLRKNATDQPTSARFLAWGYLTVNATRRRTNHDPQDPGAIDDTVAIVEAVRKRPDVDPGSVVLYGGSGGGTLALEVARYVDLAAVVAGEPATIIFMGMFTKEHVDTDADGQPAGDRRWDVMNAEPDALYTPALRKHTRDKLKAITSPVLILHGDQHALAKFNLELFVPEMLAMGKNVRVAQYPGEQHGFYWGQSENPAMPLQANRDAEAFIRSHIKTPPSPVDPSLVSHEVIESTGELQ